MAEEADVKQDFGGAVSRRLDRADCSCGGRRGEKKRGVGGELRTGEQTGRMRAVDGAVFLRISRCDSGGDKLAVAAPFSAVGGSTVRQSVRESERPD